MSKVRETIKRDAEEIQEMIMERKEMVEEMLKDILNAITDEFGEQYSDWVHDLMMDELQSILKDRFLSIREMDYQQTLQYDIDF